MHNVESHFVDSDRTSTGTLRLNRESKRDRPLPKLVELSDDLEMRRRPSRLCLIGVRPDGTRQCLLGGLLSFDQAARARIIMRSSPGYVEYKSIRILRDDAAPGGIAVRDQ